MQCQTITKKDKHYPKRLASILGSTFPQLTVAGNPDIFTEHQAPITGIFCSRSCPGSIILPAFDHITALRDQGRTVASGFHSEMEQECLKILMRGSPPIIICPARSINTMRIPNDWKKPFAERRLLILSPFDKSQSRTTATQAEQRNNLVAALADELFIIHAVPDSRTFNIAVEAVKNSKKTFTINVEENRALIATGAVPV